MSVSDLLARYRPAETVVRIQLDGSIASRLAALHGEVLAAARKETDQPEGLASRIPDLQRQVREMEEAAAETEAKIRLQALPGGRFDELKQRFPPTEEQWEEYRKRAQASPLGAVPPDVDGERFGPALIAASVVAVDDDEVSWTEEDGLALWAGLSDGARADLLEAAWRVNGESASRPLSGTGIAGIGLSASGSTTPRNGESPSRSS